MSATLPQPPDSRRELGPANLEVRRLRCRLCGAPPLEVCQRRPRADHMQRWLDAYQAGRVSKADVAKVFSEVVVITTWQVVLERAA